MITIRKVMDSSCSACHGYNAVCEFRLGLETQAGQLFRLCWKCRSEMTNACASFDLNKAYR